MKMQWLVKDSFFTGLHLQLYTEQPWNKRCILRFQLVILFAFIHMLFPSNIRIMYILHPLLLLPLSFSLWAPFVNNKDDFWSSFIYLSEICVRYFSFTIRSILQQNLCQQVQEVQVGESWRWKIFSTDLSATTALLSWIETCPIKLDWKLPYQAGLNFHLGWWCERAVPSTKLDASQNNYKGHMTAL